MTKPPWQRRIERARALMEQQAFAAEILGFFVHLSGFQERLHDRLSAISSELRNSDPRVGELSGLELAELTSSLESFLSVVERHGPGKLGELSREIRAREASLWPELLAEAWKAPAPADAQTILLQAFLQPYAELLRSQAKLKPGQHKYAVCPFCARKPAWGVLRQMGEGAARSMVCAFCFAEWDFRRLVCPGCGEENDTKLPVFTAAEFDYIRVECCEICKTYVKTVDLTKNGRAEPVVDELASSPLDLWAHEHGYAKLHKNLLGL